MLGRGLRDEGYLVSCNLTGICSKILHTVPFMHNSEIQLTALNTYYYSIFFLMFDKRLYCAIHMLSHQSVPFIQIVCSRVATVSCKGSILIHQNQLHIQWNCCNCHNLNLWWISWCFGDWFCFFFSLTEVHCEAERSLLSLEWLSTRTCGRLAISACL